MAKLIERPTRIHAAGNKPKLIDEFVGRVNSDTQQGEYRSHAKSRRMAGAWANTGVR